jgi:glycosyltransferase involved in cell wall biosynthesis
MINLGVYVSASKVVEKTTGVGKHSIGMIKSLCKNKEVNLILFGSYEVLNNPFFLFKSLKFYSLPYKTRFLELSWKVINWPKIDNYIPNVDAIYVPGEELVSSQKYNIFFTIHDTYNFLQNPKNLRKLMLKHSYRLYLKKVCNILTVSHFSKKKISELFLQPKNKITVLGNSVGFDDENLKLIKKNNKKIFEKYITIGGPLNEKKGGEHIINLCSYIESKDKDINIYIIGGIDKVFIDVFKNAELKRTKIFGHAELSEVKIIELLYNSICYLQLSNVEGFGITVIEAMHLGTPVIINEIPSLIENTNGSAICCNNKNIAFIAEEINKFKNDKDYRDKIVNLGYRNASKYTWDRFSKILISLIKKTISI